MDRKEKRVRKNLVIGVSVLTAGILIALFVIMNQKAEKQLNIAQIAAREWGK